MSTGKILRYQKSFFFFREATKLSELGLHGGGTTGNQIYHSNLLQLINIVTKEGGTKKKKKEQFSYNYNGQYYY